MEYTVIKLDHEGNETWRYKGQLLKRSSSSLTIEAFFDRSEIDLHGMSLCFGDRFVETYYFDRWYNIFEIHNKDNDQLKGWYCNIGYPVEIQENSISYKDLALDLLVFPDGFQIVLDEDEFNEINLNAVERRNAIDALKKLQTHFRIMKAGGKPIIKID
jgi:predicted RNA-binding protein associated with RNAse of E/G family